MFTRKHADATAAPPPLPNGDPQAAPGLRAVPARPASGTPSIIGADLVIVGILESTGEVQIEGDVQGDVHAGRIVVGQQAQVTGDLIANEVVVGGMVQGTICGNNVTFRSASRVEGEVYHKTLAIEQGAYFEGKSRRSADPMSVQRPASGATS
jgi:cytoskeletal protein CcmA (bactofilin family)